MLTENTILTAEMLHTEMQKLNSDQDILFFKIRHTCLVLATIELAEDTKNHWTEEDMPHLEQVKHYLSFLLRSEKTDCKIDCSHNFAAALQKHGIRIRYAACQILANNLEKFLKIQTEKVFKDAQHCGDILNEYACLLDALDIIFSLNEDDENIHIQKVLTLFEQVRNNICQQLLYTYESFDQFLKAPAKGLSPVLVMWIMQVCLTEHEEVLRFELGSWLNDRLIASCAHALSILPEPNFEKLSDVEQKMLIEIVEMQEIHEKMDENDQNGKDIPF